MRIECNVIVTEAPTDKAIIIAETLHHLLGINLKEARYIVQSVPASIMVRVSPEDAQFFQKELQQAGARIKIAETIIKDGTELIYTHGEQLGDGGILDEYYSALDCINSSYKELLDADKELNWYEDKLKQADQLAKIIEFDYTSLLSDSKIAFGIAFSKNRIESILASIHDEIANLNYIKNKFTHTRFSLSKNYEETMLTLHNKKTDAITNLENFIEQSITQLYEQGYNNQAQQQSVQASLNHLETQLRDDQAQKQSVQASLNHLETQLRDNQAQKQSVQVSLNHLETQLRDNQAQKQSVQVSLNHLETQLKDLETQLKDLETQLQDNQVQKELVQASLNNFEKERQINNPFFVGFNLGNRSNFEIQLKDRQSRQLTRSLNDLLRRVIEQEKELFKLEARLQEEENNQIEITSSKIKHNKECIGVSSYIFITFLLLTTSWWSYIYFFLTLLLTIFFILTIINCLSKIENLNQEKNEINRNINRNKSYLLTKKNKNIKDKEQLFEIAQQVYKLKDFIHNHENNIQRKKSDLRLIKGEQGMVSIKPTIKQKILDVKNKLQLLVQNELQIEQRILYLKPELQLIGQNELEIESRVSHDRKELQLFRLREDKIQQKILEFRNKLQLLAQNESQIQQEIRTKEENSKKDILKFESQLMEEISEEDIRLHQNILQIESQFNRDINKAKHEAILSISTVISYVNVAHKRILNLLSEAQQYQKQFIADINNKVNEPIATESNSTPPRLLGLPWSDLRWTFSEDSVNAYRPQISGLAPGILRVGELHLVENSPQEQASLTFSTPAFVSIRALSSAVGDRRPGHIAIFSNDANSRQAAVAAIQSIALKTICTFPVRKLRCIFIDPVGMGNNLPFKKLPEIIAGPKTYTRIDDIKYQLRALTVHIEQVIQNYLGKDYQTIEEFNTAKSFVEEAYRYLFAVDFPTSFDNNSWEDLKSILDNGARAGVYVVLHIDETIEKPRNSNYEIFETYCTILRPSGETDQGIPLFTTKFPKNLQFNILLDQPPSNEHFNQLTEAITKANQNIKVETVPFKEVYPEQDYEWSYDSRQIIKAPIGIIGAIEKLEFWLGKNAEGQEVTQAILAGKPGAGKTYTLHAIINSLAMRYAPDELEMYLLDYKEGVEFQIYVNPEQGEINNPNDELQEYKALPHAKVVSIESDREFGLSVLKYIQKLVEERGRLFKSLGVTNLKEYRDKCTEKMPRILVVIDEFQYMFRDSDNITQQLNDIFEDLVKRGRAFGLHLLLASQSPRVNNFRQAIYSFIDLRMAQQMDKNTAGAVLAEGNTDAVDLLDRPGKIIYNQDFGRRSYNQLGQVVDTSLRARQEALLHIQSIGEQKNYQRPEPLVLFHGSRPTKLKHNRQLAQLSAMSHWLSLRDLNKQVIQDPEWLVEETPGVSWLGEAMRIGNHTKAIFRRRSRSNMLIVGSSEETVFGILGGILLSLVHCYEPKNAEFQIIDLSYPNEDNYWGEMSIHFRNAFNTHFPTQVGKRFSNPDNEILPAETILQNVYAEFERRQQQRNENPHEVDLGHSIFFLCALGSINRAQNLRSVIGNRGEDMPSPDAKNLIKLVSQGSELGIHTIIWLDNMKTFSKLNGDNRSWLMHFDLRVGLTMAADDSRLLFGDGYAQSLPRLRAYFRDTATETGLEKFKPYAVPSTQEISEYSKRFQQRFLQ